MRADELRTCLIREISRAIAVGRLAQEALLDGDDDAALANLRWHWRVTRAGLAPLACELGALRKEGRQLPRLLVRITAADRRAPYGRSRALRLTHNELDELIAVALRIERRTR